MTSSDEFGDIVSKFKYCNPLLQNIRKSKDRGKKVIQPQCDSESIPTQHSQNQCFIHIAARKRKQSLVNLGKLVT